MLKRVTMDHLKLRWKRELYAPAVKKWFYACAVILCREEVWSMDRYDLHCVRGETVEQILYFVDEDGNDMDLTGLTGYCQIREYPGAESVLASATVTVSVAASKVTLTFTAAQTAALDAGCYAYDFAMKDSEGAVTYYLGGWFRVDERVTEISAS